MMSYLQLHCQYWNQEYMSFLDSQDQKTIFMCFKDHYRASAFFLAIFLWLKPYRTYRKREKERWKRPLRLTALIPAPAKHYFWNSVCFSLSLAALWLSTKSHRSGQGHSTGLICSLFAAPSRTTCCSAGHSSAWDAQRLQRSQLVMKDALRQ